MGWFSDLEILEIHQKTQKQCNTIPNTSNDATQKQHTRNEQPTLENERPQYQVTLQKHYLKNNRQI